MIDKIKKAKREILYVIILITLAIVFVIQTESFQDWLTSI